MSSPSVDDSTNMAVGQNPVGAPTPKWDPLVLTHSHIDNCSAHGPCQQRPPGGSAPVQRPRDSLRGPQLHSFAFHSFSFGHGGSRGHRLPQLPLNHKGFGRLARFLIGSRAVEGSRSARKAFVTQRTGDGGSGGRPQLEDLLHHG